MIPIPSLFIPAAPDSPEGINRGDVDISHEMPVPRLGHTLPLLLLCMQTMPVAGADARERRGVAEVTPVVAARDVHAGDVAMAALRVELPAGYHVNSHTPRDPSLIPLSVAVDPPLGTALAGLAFPVPSILRQQGSDQPLSVFERSFTIGVRLQVAPDAPPGDVRIPVRSWC